VLLDARPLPGGSWPAPGGQAGQSRPQVGGRSPQHSFWLQTSTDRFYPDFVCKLRDGRILGVEYKGHDRWSNSGLPGKLLVLGMLQPIAAAPSVWHNSLRLASGLGVAAALPSLQSWWQRRPRIPPMEARQEGYHARPCKTRREAMRATTPTPETLQGRIRRAFGRLHAQPPLQHGYSVVGRPLRRL